MDRRRYDVDLSDYLGMDTCETSIRIVAVVWIVVAGFAIAFFGC